MTQTPGDLWSRLRRPLLEAESRFAWAAAVFDGLRLRVSGEQQELAALFARILFNDAERGVLAVGFSEAPGSRSACEVLVRTEREAGAVRVEIALAGRLPKEVELDGTRLVTYPGAGDASAGMTQGPFPAVVVRHL